MKPCIIEQPKICDRRGNLSFIQQSDNCPMHFKRCYWLYDIPTDTRRYGRALCTTAEMLIAMSGSFDVETISCFGEKTVFHLDRPNKALYLPPMTWRRIFNFSSGCVMTVLASEKYVENDYLRNLQKFNEACKKHNNIEIQDNKIADPQQSDCDQHSSVDDCRIVKLTRIRNAYCSLTPVEDGDAVKPFDLQRIYYIYDVPGGAKRGGHAHKQMQALMVAASGAFDVEVDDGNNRRTFRLNKPYEALYIPGGIWRTVTNFTSSAVCMVLASQRYDEGDYIRRKTDFIKYTKSKPTCQK